MLGSDRSLDQLFIDAESTTVFTSTDGDEGALAFPCPLIQANVFEEFDPIVIDHSTKVTCEALLGGSPVCNGERCLLRFAAVVVDGNVQAGAVYTGQLGIIIEQRKCQRPHREFSLLDGQP